MVGQNLGPYRIVEQMRDGGRVPIYKAYDPSNDRYVCIKVVPEHISQRPGFRQRFLVNSRVLARFEHAHILPVYSCSVEHDVAYIDMPYLPTGNLADMIQQGLLPLDEVARILYQIAQALDHAHHLGILHRGLKPSNVLVDSNRNIYVMDFGIARIVETTMELTGESILDRLAYMSPEQCKGIDNVEETTDIYSLGIILFELLTRRRPFFADTIMAIIVQHLTSSIPPLRDLHPGLPEAVERVVHKAMAKEPADRFDTASALADAFASSI